MAETVISQKYESNQSSENGTTNTGQDPILSDSLRKVVTNGPSFEQIASRRFFIHKLTLAQSEPYDNNRLNMNINYQTLIILVLAFFNMTI